MGLSTRLHRTHANFNSQKTEPVLFMKFLKIRTDDHSELSFNFLYTASDIFGKPFIPVGAVCE